VGAQNQAGLDVSIVPRLRSKGPRVKQCRGAGSGSERIVEIGGEDCAGAAGALGDVAVFVEGIVGCGLCDEVIAREQAVCAEGVDGGDAAAGVEGADGIGAVIEGVGALTGTFCLTLSLIICFISK